MNTYYLRCRESHVATLVDRGVRMGVLTQQGGVVAPVGAGAWDVIGRKAEFDQNGALSGYAGGSADPWWHINFRTPFDLRERAMAAAAAGDTDIANGMAEIANYFITDSEGKVCAPEFPMRVFL